MNLLSNFFKSLSGYKTLLLGGMLYSLASCVESKQKETEIAVSLNADSLAIAKMIAVRERAMINKNIQPVMAQFSEQASWINSQGYFFEGKQEVSKFHGMLAANDSLDYYYEAGKPRIRILDDQNALAYYGWKMFWYKKDNPADTTFKEIGLMTLSAQKKDTAWQWIAVTNQHTPWFYKTIEAVTIN